MMLMANGSARSIRIDLSARCGGSEGAARRCVWHGLFNSDIAGSARPDVMTRVEAKEAAQKLARAERYRLGS